MSFAENTAVPVERTKAEIETLVKKYGGTGYIAGWDNDAEAAMVLFRMQGRYVRFRLKTTVNADVARSPKGQKRNERRVAIALEQEERRRWRALLLVIRAKIEAVDSGIVDFESEFLAQIVLPDNSTVGERVAPSIADAYASGKMGGFGKLLLGSGAPARGASS